MSSNGLSCSEIFFNVETFNLLNNCFISGSFFKEDFIATTSLGVALPVHILEINLSKSPISFRLSFKSFLTFLFFNNSSTLSCLFLIGSKSRNGAEIHFFSSLPPIAV